jgi:branched-subunit amino acid aminotransferase/4-amino-4-deoxychorismate lyase
VRTIEAAELACAPAIALTNALIGVRPCSALDGRPLDPAWSGFAALRKALSAAP